jgi:hypothetical protein
MEQQSRALLQGDSASAQHVPSGPQKSSGVQQETPPAGQESLRERQLLELELEPLLELTELALLLEPAELVLLAELELELRLELAELVLLLELAELELLLPPPQVQSRSTQVSPGPHSVVVVHWVWQIPPTQTSTIVPLQSLSTVQGPQVPPTLALLAQVHDPKMAVAANALPTMIKRNCPSPSPLTIIACPSAAKLSRRSRSNPNLARQ